VKVQEKYLFRALDLAKNGLGLTYPNPMVGCVIVYKDKIIGEGFHIKAGEAHAEVNAINSVTHKELLPESVVYVSLEPCSHFGKTPPCSDLLIAHRVGKVVIATADPFAAVSGNGIKKLREAGIPVEFGFFKEKAFELNKRFFTYHLAKRPYITLKFAQSQDGYIDKRDSKIGEPLWISNNYSQQLSHKLRAQESAILVGKNTINSDDPSLTTRTWGGSNPMRIVADRNLELDSSKKIFNDQAQTLVFYQEAVPSEFILDDHVSYARIEGSDNLTHQIIEELFQRGIQSLIVEGGAEVLKSFIQEGLYDEIWRFTGDVEFNSGIKAPEIKGVCVDEYFIKKDRLEIFKASDDLVYQQFLDAINL